MDLQTGRQLAAVLDLNCRIGRRNQYTEMMHRSPTSLNVCVSDKLGSAGGMSKLGQPVIPARLIRAGEVSVGTAWARDEKAVGHADTQLLHSKCGRSGVGVQRACNMSIAGYAMKTGNARSVLLEFCHQVCDARGELG